MDYSTKNPEKRPEPGPESGEKPEVKISGPTEPETPTSPRKKEEESERPEIPRELPVLPVRGTVVYPGTVVSLNVGREKSKRLIDAVLAGNKLLAIFAQHREDIEDPAIDDIFRVGTAATVLKLLRMPDGTNTLLVHGLVRVGLEEITATEPYWRGLVNPRDDRVPPSLELEALMYTARRSAEQVIELSPNAPEEALVVLHNLEEAGPLADFLAANLSLGLAQKQELLETFDVLDRLRKINATLNNQLEVLKLSQKIQSQVRGQMEKNQREYFLHEQMKAIQKELGEDDGAAGEIEDLRKRVETADMPEPVLKEAKRELQRLGRIPPASPEHSLARDYLDWLCEMPWKEETRDHLDLDEAEKVLNEDHYGLEKIKRRILEYLAVRKLKPEGKGPILCFAGPPGVGKTSLGQSIARAMGRKFIRISLGGVRDEADIRGHRRTYIGAIPGRIVQEIRKAGTRNPVMMLDELDKLGADFRGDPASALLEVLDPQQNHSFTDHYLAVPFDLSKVLFIATVNYLDPIPPALRDRMEVIELSSYTTSEKLEIAKRYLVPRQLEENGLGGRGVRFADDALRAVIENYTREAGVRNLEREIGTVCRGLAAKAARGRKLDRAITPKDLVEYLGQPKFEREEAAIAARTPGIVTGLAYTPYGGEIIFVEAMQMPGRGGFTLTGQIGDVMRESAQAGLSLVRSRANQWGVPVRHLAQTDIHIHVPAGGIPKDGPSAGVAMVTALVSMLTNRPVDSHVGMTGEITFRGLVLPIGGVKEKVLAAHRAGLKKVILPARNRADLQDVPPDVRKELEFVFAEEVEDVLAAALPLEDAARTIAARPAAGKKRPPARRPGPHKSRKPGAKTDAGGGGRRASKRRPA